MCTASKRVDRVVEREVGAGHLVEGGLGADLVEVDAEGLRRIEGPNPLDIQPWKAPSLLSLHPLRIPAHRTYVRTLTGSGSPIQRLAGRCWGEGARAAASRTQPSATADPR